MSSEYNKKSLTMAMVDNLERELEALKREHQSLVK